MKTHHWAKLDTETLRRNIDVKTLHLGRNDHDGHFKAVACLLGNHNGGYRFYFRGF